MPDLSIIFDMGVVALRFLMPVYAIIIVYQCFAAMRRRASRNSFDFTFEPCNGRDTPCAFLGKIQSAEAVTVM